MKISHFFSLVILAGILIFSATNPAFAGKKSFWDVFFGPDKPEEPEYDPSQTLIAPFADDTVKDMRMFEGGQSDIVALDMPHTTDTEIGRWLVKIVSELLSVKAGYGKQHLEQKKVFFTPTGYAQFTKFLSDKGISKVLESGRYNVNSYAKEDPLLLNSGEIDKRFRWAFEVPIMVSYLDSRGFDYRRQDSVNQDLMLTIQVGRAGNIQSEDNYYEVLIETFSGVSKKIQ